MEGTVKLLGTYAGRDKILRTTSYAAMLLIGGVKGKSVEHLGTIARQISATRVVLRLFDDLPMLAYTCGYGLGKHEKDPVRRVLSVAGNLAGVAYFPIEHVAWLADNKILSLNSSPWWVAGVATWLTGLVINILKSLRIICIIRHRRATLIKQKKLESPDKSDLASETFKQSTRDLNKEEFKEFLNIIKNFADLLNAVNWMPKGFLWSGRFATPQQGFFGTISSLVGLYQMTYLA